MCSLIWDPCIVVSLSTVYKQKKKTKICFNIFEIFKKKQ